MSEYLCWMLGHTERDEAVIVHAFDAWSAAKEFAKRADQESGSYISNGAMDSGAKLRVHVLSPDGVESMWDVWPDIVIVWYGCVAGVAGIANAAPGAEEG
jgi:hypothetical protein